MKNTQLLDKTAQQPTIYSIMNNGQASSSETDETQQQIIARTHLELLSKPFSCLFVDMSLANVR